MRVERPLTFLLKNVLLLCLLLTSSAWAQDYKGETPTPTPTRKYYKDEVESNDYASNYVPNQAQYNGRVYDSDLYQGPLVGDGYSPSTNRSLHDGFYLGAEVGYDSYAAQTNINSIVGGVSIFQENPQLNAVGISYMLVGGFGRVFDDPLYLGTEIFYNYSEANTSQNIGVFDGAVGIYHIKTQVLNTYGASLMPGYKLTDSALLYLKGGYTRIQAKTYETSTILGLNNAQTNGVNAVHFGVGFEVDVYKNWSVRGEYTHLNAQSFTTQLGTRISPSDNQFMFGLIMHFV